MSPLYVLGQILVMILVLVMLGRWFVMTRAALAPPMASRLTEILAMDEAQRQTVERSIAPVRRRWTIIAAIPVIFMGSIALYLANMSLNRPIRTMDIVLPYVFVTVGVVISAIMAYVGWRNVRALRADLAEGRFARTTGNMSITYVRSAKYLNVGDRVLIVESGVADVIGRGMHGVVDYSAHGHVIFEIRDDKGMIVYQNRYYDPSGYPVQHPSA
jgi:hypothetical protein